MEIRPANTLRSPTATVSSTRQSYVYGDERTGMNQLFKSDTVSSTHCTQWTVMYFWGHNVSFWVGLIFHIQSVSQRHDWQAQNELREAYMQKEEKEEESEEWSSRLVYIRRDGLNNTLLPAAKLLRQPDLWCEQNLTNCPRAQGSLFDSLSHLKLTLSLISLPHQVFLWHPWGK